MSSNNSLIPPHLRFICPNTVYHVVNKTVGGTFLLRPDAATTSVITGVLAQACRKFERVSLFETAVMSNHFHLIMQAPQPDFSLFLAFIKREISRRVGWLHNWKGTFWDGRFKLSALPTAQSQLDAQRYVLSQGAKEDLVELPWHWPGVHSAVAHKRRAPLRGRWLDGTAYAKAKHAAKALAPQETARKRTKVHRTQRAEFESDVELHFAPLPALAHLSREQYAHEMDTIMNDIAETERVRRLAEGKRVLGRQEVMCQPIERRSVTRPIPWLERGRRLLAWANQAAEETRDYIARYWEYQGAYRFAAVSTLYSYAHYPEGAFLGGRWCHTT
jgi:REP element-mobilizing transposase RayT